MVGLTTVTVAVSGGTVEVDLRGEGERLLVISPGGIGIGRAYSPLAKALASDRRVASYDRRGHGRSADLPTDDISVAAHAADLAAIIETLTGEPDSGTAGPPDTTCDIVASSAGTSVALAAVEEHPHLIRTLIAHEPPVVGLLPDAEQWRAMAELFRATSVESGPALAYDLFLDSIATGEVPRPAMALPDVVLPEWRLLFERETIGLYDYTPSIRALRESATRIVPVVGAQSLGYWHAATTAALATALGVDLVTISGSHVAPMVDQLTFAADVARLLEAT